MLGRRGRRILLENCFDLHVVVRHGEFVVGDYKSRRRFDLPFLKVVALVGRCAQSDFRTGRSLCKRCGSRSVSICFHGDGKLGRRGLGYRNRQLLRIAAHAVFRLNGEFGGAIRSRRAADLAGVLVQAQTGRQAAVFDAPCDGCGAVGSQGLTISLAHLAVRQGVRGDGHAMAAGSKLCRQLAYIRRNVISRFVELAIAAKPLKVVVGISVGAGQAVGGRCGKCAAGFHDNLYAALIAQLTAAKVQGNGFQPVIAQRVKAQNLKDGAESLVWLGERVSAAIPVAGRHVPTVCTGIPIFPNILPPGFYFFPVLDVSAALVQYLIPFVALGRAAF